MLSLNRTAVGLTREPMITEPGSLARREKRLSDDPAAWERSVFMGHRIKSGDDDVDGFSRVR